MLEYQKENLQKKFEIGNKVQKSMDFNMQMVNHGILSY
jgi:hypothetical protein